MDTSRVLVAVILSLVIVFAYQELVLKRMYPPQNQVAAEQAKQDKSAETAALGNRSGAGAPGIAGESAANRSAGGGAGATAPGTSTAAPGAATSGQVPTALGAAKGGAPERNIEIDSDYYVAVFTTGGARLKSFKLKRYKETAAKDSGWYDMVAVPAGGLLPLGVVITRDGQMLDDRKLAYTTSSPDKLELTGTGNSTVTLEAETSDGTKIQKTFTFRNASYVFDLSVAVTGGKTPNQLGVSMSQPLTAHQGYYDVPELQADVKDKVLTQNEKNLKKGVEPVSGPIIYAGFGDRYFLSVFLPTDPSNGTLAMAYAGEEALAQVRFDGTTQLKTRVYMGPKLLEALEAVSPALHKAIDFGWAGILALIFLRTLKLFHLIAPNYGVDIILVTVSIRILFLPISIKSQRSMMRMQRLQPQMERLREKYKDNNEQLQREMVDLYKRNHVNPLGGCAPMALQLPIFIGLYEALLNSVELRHAPFIGWINDLSTPDCLHVPGIPQLPMMHCHGLPILVLLMGASSFLQQYMTPTSPDPSQQRMMMLTPLIFTIMLINFPAGLSLYYFSSNVLGVVQQYFLNREFKQYSPAT